MMEQALRFLGSTKRMGVWIALAHVVDAVAQSLQLEYGRRAWLSEELQTRLSEDPAFELEHGHVRMTPRNGRAVTFNVLV